MRQAAPFSPLSLLIFQDIAILMLFNQESTLLDWTTFMHPFGLAELLPGTPLLSFYL